VNRRARPWLIRVGTLIDGVSPAALEDAAIRIDGSVITSVGPWVAPERDRADEAVDLGACVALPGFIDVHTHMTLFADGRSYEDMAMESDESMLLAAAANARTHLESGVTTARDNGSRGRLGMILRDAIASGAVSGPRLLASGRPVTEPGGHFHWCHGEAQGPEGVRDAVSKLVSEKADHIKIMASGGGTLGTDPRQASYSVRELRAAVKTAHGFGLLTTAHCRALESMRRAVEAGLDCMEHSEFLRQDGRMAFDEAVASEMAATEIYVSPTLQASGWDTIVRLREARDTRRLSYSEHKALAYAEAETAAVLENFGRMLEAGLGPRMVGGTDAGCFDFSFGHIDYCMALMVRGGMDHAQAIRACTSVAAEALGLGGSVGALVPGHQADIVILGGSPLDRIEAVADVRAVIKEGRIVSSRLPQLPATSFA
jgi:imidazolonepropionase-like amidohydrolase